MGATQAPALQTKPVAQSLLEVQVVLHPPPSLPQAKLSGQGAEPMPMGAQAPSPLQVPCWSVEPLHETGQVMASLG